MLDTNWKWLGVALLAITGYTILYNNDTPQSIQEEIMDELSITSFQYSLLYVFLCIPSIVVPFVAGVLVHSWSPIKTILLFLIFSITGSGLCFLSGYIKSYPLMLLGRFLFGTGGQSIFTVLAGMGTIWFEVHQRAFVQCLMLMMSRAGTTSTTFFSPKFLDLSETITAPFSFCFFLMIFGSFTIFGFLFMERVTKNKKKFHHDPASCNQFRSFTKEFLLYLGIGFMIFLVILGFLTIQNSVLMELYGWSNSEAGIILSIYLVVAIFSLPIFGLFVDKFGKRGILQVLSLVSLLLMSTWFLFGPKTQKNYFVTLVPLLLLSFSFTAQATTFWSILSILAPKVAVATAMGAGVAGTALSQTVSSIICGFLIQSAETKLQGYYNVAWYYFFLGVLTLIVAVCAAIKYDKLINPKRETKTPNEAEALLNGEKDRGMSVESFKDRSFYSTTEYGEAQEENQTKNQNENENIL